MFNQNTYSDTTIRLRPAYDQTWKRNWGDFYGPNGEVVVTAFTLRDHLENEYTSQVHDEGSDSVDIEVRTVGVHLMDTHYEDDSKVDESYLIVTEEEDITPSVMLVLRRRSCGAEYVGERVERGLFEASDGTRYNADVNGAVARKSTGKPNSELFSSEEGVERAVDAPQRISLSDLEDSQTLKETSLEAPPSRSDG